MLEHDWKTSKLHALLQDSAKPFTTAWTPSTALPALLVPHMPPAAALRTLPATASFEPTAIGLHRPFGSLGQLATGPHRLPDTVAANAAGEWQSVSGLAATVPVAVAVAVAAAFAAAWGRAESHARTPRHIDSDQSHKPPGRHC